MKESLKPGARSEITFVLPPSKMVPALYPEADEFQAMPQVLATGFLVGLLEWACIKAVNPHIDWPREQTLGTRVEVTHEVASPPGRTIRATAEIVELDGRRIVFAVEAFDGDDRISRGHIERFVVDKARFDAKMAQKRSGSQ